MRSVRSSGLPTDAEAGFSLIELMVVVFIIGLAAGAVVLTMPPAGRGALDDAERFAARVAAARDLAIIERRPVRLWVTGSGYGFEQRTKGQWTPAGKDVLETRDWTGDVRAAMAGGDQARRVFDTTGMPSSPLEVTLSRDTVSASVFVEGSGNVRVE